MNIFVNGSRADLIKGLHYMIGLVEQSTASHFDMNNYRKCVIGQTYFNGNYWCAKEKQVLFDVFGITVNTETEHDVMFFADWRFDKTLTRPKNSSVIDLEVCYNQDQLNVLRLFTSAINASQSDIVTRLNWLVKARSLYNEMMGIK